MRFSCLLLFALVLLAFPAVAAAEPTRLASAQVEPDTLSVEIEHALLTQDAADDEAQEEGLPGSERGRAAVAVALRYLGTPYRWAGSSPSGFDCSGFVMYVYGRIGVKLPHNGTMLWGHGRPVSRNRLEPGDIVFFNGLSHVGIYIGRGRFVHSPHTGDVVKISRLSESWYRSTFVGGRRP
jgi:cell wall-associated NlpC family hydrolase